MQTMKRPRTEHGAALRAILAPLAQMGSLDDDVARFCLLSDADAAYELDEVLWQLPELRRYFVVRLLKALMRAVLAGGGDQWRE